jgi:hypothetical protein
MCAVSSQTLCGVTHSRQLPQDKEEDVPAAAAAAKPAAAQAAKASSHSQGSAGVPAPLKKEPAKAGAKKGGAKVLQGQRGIKSFFAKK